MSGRRAIHGLHAVTAALKRRPEAVFEVFLDPGRNDPRARKVADLAREGGVRVHHADAARLDGLAKGSRHQGVVGLCRGSEAGRFAGRGTGGARAEPPLLLVLDGVQDPHNLGACLRVADAMGVHAVIAPKDRAVGLNATVHKVASGAAESVPFIVVTNLARTLRDLKDKGIMDTRRGRDRRHRAVRSQAFRCRWRWCSAPRERDCDGLRVRPATN